MYSSTIPSLDGKPSAHAQSLNRSNRLHVSTQGAIGGHSVERELPPLRKYSALGALNLILILVLIYCGVWYVRNTTRRRSGAAAVLRFKENGVVVGYWLVMFHLVTHAYELGPSSSQFDTLQSDPRVQRAPRYPSFRSSSHDTTQLRECHSIQGDTCWAPLQRFGVSVAQIQSWNPSINSGCMNLQIGQQLCVRN